MNLLAQMTKSVREFLSPPGPALPRGPLRAVNRTRGTVLATRLEVAATGPARRKGLLGRAQLAPGEGLWIIPCESVHTWFMRFSIDLIYLDRAHRVRKVRSAVGPWRLSACFSAHSILELPAGVIRATQTGRGDELELEPVEADPTAA